LLGEPSKTDATMVDEVLCKLLRHNLTCLIQEQETLGIAPIFWKPYGQGTSTTVCQMVKYVAGCVIAATTALFGCIAGALIGGVIGDRMDAQAAAQGQPRDPNNPKVNGTYNALFGAFLGTIFTPAVTLTVIRFLMSRAEERERERKRIEEHQSRRRR
jgi:hypothetical protein